MRRMLAAARAWCDSWTVEPPAEDDPRADRVDWLRVLPFLGMHAACVAAPLTGVSTTAVLVAAALFALRMFAITGFYHRYFAHRSFRTSRAAQFVFAVLGAAAVQRGPLWWAAHHRLHHRHSDQEPDAHSPRQRGFWHAHVGWFLNRRNHATRVEQVPDLARFPELVFLDRYDMLVPVLLAVALFAGGEAAAAWAPGLGTDGPQLLLWGFFVSTVALYHATFTINSLAHRFGSRRYATGDDSRNSLLLALLTFGEGWHNNHHRYPGAVRQGFRWWEVDLTWYLLLALERLGVVWDLRGVPAHLRRSAP